MLLVGEAAGEASIVSEVAGNGRADGGEPWRRSFAVRRELAMGLQSITAMRTLSGLTQSGGKSPAWAYTEAKHDLVPHRETGCFVSAH